jgi:hypothetical protein
MHDLTGNIVRQTVLVQRKLDILALAGAGYERHGLHSPPPSWMLQFNAPRRLKIAGLAFLPQTSVLWSLLERVARISTAEIMISSNDSIDVVKDLHLDRDQQVARLFSPDDWRNRHDSWVERPPPWSSTIKERFLNVPGLLVDSIEEVIGPSSEQLIAGTEKLLGIERKWQRPKNPRDSTTRDLKLVGSDRKFRNTENLRTLRHWYPILRALDLSSLETDCTLEEVYRDLKAWDELTTQEAITSYEESKDFATLKTEASTFLRTHLRDDGSRSFFVTKHGLLGIGPRYTEPGNRAVVLSGSSTVYVISSLPQNHWRLLGNAYLVEPPVPLQPKGSDVAGYCTWNITVAREETFTLT